MYLGGCLALERDGCLKIVNGQFSLIRLLKCSYDEADDRIMFHLNHAVKVDRFDAAHVMTGDTYIFVNLMYHFRDWRANGLSGIWFHHLGNITPVHQAVDNLPDTVVEILPAIHALSGCDTTSKITGLVTKNTTLIYIVFVKIYCCEEAPCTGFRTYTKTLGYIFLLDKIANDTRSFRAYLGRTRLNTGPRRSYRVTAALRIIQRLFWGKAYCG